MPLGEEVVNDYRFLRLSLRAHPAQFLRADLDARGILRNETLRTMRTGARVKISGLVRSLPPMPLGEKCNIRFLDCSCARIRRSAPSRPQNLTQQKPRRAGRGNFGLVTCRQRPGSAKGVVFMTIEDESAVANVIVWPRTFERVRPVVLGARYVAVTGRVQQESGVIHVVADQLEDLTILLGHLADHGADIEGTDIQVLARADEVRRPIEDQREARAHNGRQSRLERLLREMPELAGDLDVTAPGSAHAPTRRAPSGGHFQAGKK